MAKNEWKWLFHECGHFCAPNHNFDGRKDMFWYILFFGNLSENYLFRFLNFALQCLEHGQGQNPQQKLALSRNFWPKKRLSKEFVALCVKSILPVGPINFFRPFKCQSPFFPKSVMDRKDLKYNPEM